MREYKHIQSIIVTYLWHDTVWGKSLSKHGACSVIETRRVYNSDESRLINVVIN